MITCNDLLTKSTEHGDSVINAYGKHIVTTALRVKISATGEYHCA